MALLAQFTVGPACAGDNHLPSVTLALSNGQTVPFSTSKEEARAPLTAEERETFARLLFRVSVRQVAGTSTAAQIKAALEAKVFDLTVLG